MKSIFTHTLGILVCTLILLNQAYAQILRKDSFQLGTFNTPPEKGLASSTITDIEIFNHTIWFGTGAGLSKTKEDSISFLSFGQEQGLGRGGISALAVSNEVVWVATGFDSTTEFGSFQTGGGLAYSLDEGETWTFVPQPGATNVQNITFDIALRDDEIWITSFGGGLRKSNDLGQTWEIVTPDSFVFDPLGNLNHRAFSVLAVEGTLWVGTAGGINRSTDGGSTWTRFSHQNQANPISGNFVVAIGHQSYDHKNIIWAGTRETTVESKDSTEFRGVSWSEDQGFTWRTALKGETVHNFAFDDSVVYAASSNGLYKSIDGGATWAVFPNIEDTTGTRKIFTIEFFSAGISSNHTLWAGSKNGLAKTSNNGLTWEVFQVFERTPIQRERISDFGRFQKTIRTYAYPNPFSPKVHNILNGSGHVRFQYNTNQSTRVTLKIFDFAMRWVATVVEDVPRPGDSHLYETWDGRDARGINVDNGIYFYRLELEGDGTFWGKLIVLN